MNRYLFLLVPVACLLLMAAGPGAEDDLIRAANAAFLRGDTEAADALYSQAEERTGDPGLVAFNRAAVLFQRGEFREAELHYMRVLDDKACPPERAARAWFNRGTCLLRRGGSPAIYRGAVACFDRCLESPAADEPLKADARHNLELAKLLWFEANKVAPKKETPNDPPPPDVEPPPSKDKGNPDNGGTEQTDPNGGPNGSQAQPQMIQGTVPKSAAATTDAKAAGNTSTLPVLKDDTPTQQQLSPEDAREYLRRAEARIRQNREKMNEVLRGPDRPGVRDW
jgi:tetratricopeptide (TPR) repeat protein